MTLLLLTRDPELLAAVGRIAAGAGVQLTIRDDTGQALSLWSAATVVLVGDDLLDDVVAVGPPRREDVHAVSFAPDREVFRAAVEVGVTSVLTLPEGDAALLTALADADEVPGRGRAIGVLGGSGGVGASTFACALGQVAGRHAPSLVMDLDPLGPGIDRLLGVEDHDGLVWEDLITTQGRLGARALRESVPRRDGAGVLGWQGQPTPVSSSGVRDVAAAARRGHQVVVLDLSRHDPALPSLLGLCDVTVLVATPTVMGAAAAARVVRACPDVSRLVLGVRGRGAASPAGLEAATGLRVVVELPHERRLSESVELGMGPVRGSRSRLSGAVTDFLGAVA